MSTFIKSVENRFLFLEILKLSTSLSLYRITSFLRFFFTILFISRIDHEFLAASGLIGSIQNLLFVPSGILIALSFLIEKHAKDIQTKSLWLFSGLLLSIIIGIITTIFCFYLRPILFLFKINLSLIDHVWSFFYLYTPSILPGCIAYAIQNYLIGSNRQNISLISNIIGTSVMILCASCPDKWYCFNLRGINKIAFCCFLYQCVILLLTIPFIRKEILEIKKIIHKNRLRFFLMFKNQLFLGISVCFQSINEHIFYFIRITMASWSGTFSLIAQNIVLQYLFFMFPIIIGFSQSASIMSSKKWHSFSQYKKILFFHIAICSAILLLVVCFCFFIQETFISLYIRNVQVENTIQSTIKSLFIISGFYIILYGIKNIILSFLRGIKKVVIPLLIDIFINWSIGILFSYLLVVKINYLNILYFNFILTFSMFLTVLLLLCFVYKIKATSE